MPVIGITSSLNETEYLTRKEYVTAISHNGGVPLVLPCGEEKNVAQFLDLIDGLLLSGGGDIDPKLYGEDPAPETTSISGERDRFEMALITEALRRNMPILGICRGAQIMNVALGGTMIQHVECHSVRDKRFEYVHEVLVEEDNLLRQIVGREKISVNTLHHQVIGQPGNGVRIIARATDGVVEAIQVEGQAFALGVEWHPEGLYHQYPEHNQIFQAFLNYCSSSR